MESGKEETNVDYARLRELMRRVRAQAAEAAQAAERRAAERHTFWEPDLDELPL